MADTIESYEEVSVIWDGALSEIVNVYDGVIESIAYGGMDTHEGDSFDGWLARIEADASESGDLVEVHSVTHYHAPDFDGECACAQYSTDHTPIYTFGPDADDD